MFTKKIAIMGVFGALALASCADNRAPGAGAGAGSGAMALGKGCHSTQKRCVVVIDEDSSKPCGFSFDPDEVMLKKSWQRFVIVWRLPRGYEFRDGVAAGDGVKFAKEPDENQFEDGYATDNDDGDPPSAPAVSKQRFRWVYKNDLNQDRIYHYLVQFHRKNSTNNAPIICDPAISNLGGN